MSSFILFGWLLLVSVGALFSIAPAIETDDGTGEGFGIIGPFFGITFIYLLFSNKLKKI
jgi:hypothetical protein